MKRILSIFLAAILLFVSVPVVSIAAAPEGFETRFNVDVLEGKWKDAAEVEHDTILVEYQLKGQGIKGAQGAWIAVDLTKLIWADIESDGGNVNDYIGEGKAIVPGKAPERFSIMVGDIDTAPYYYAIKEPVKSGRIEVDNWSFGAYNFNVVAVSADGNTLYLCPQPSQYYSVNYSDFETIVSFRFAVRPGVVLASDSIRYITDEERDALNQSYKIAMNDGVSGGYYSGDRSNPDTLPAPVFTGNAGITGEPTVELVDAATPVITGAPTGAIYAVNATATALTVTATVSDSGTLTYAWYKNAENSNEGGELVGSESSYTPNVDTIGKAYYYVVVTNTNEAATGAKTATAKSEAVAIEVKAYCDVNGHDWSADWTTDADGHWHACSGCTEKDSYAVHVFDQRVEEDKYLASAADCTNPAKYNFSCVCGVAGTETFESGEAKGHTFDKQVAEDKYLAFAADCTNPAKYYYSCECGETGSEMFESGEALGHTFDKQVTEDKYLAFAADCTNAAKYFYSCVCGEAGTETFEFGAALGHTFDKQVAEDKYLASVADCTNPAKYFYSCECGEAGTETFDFGTAEDHNWSTEWVVDAVGHWHTCSGCDEKDSYATHDYSKEVAEDKYLVSAADCTNPAKYYKSCECGLVGTEMFESGEAKGHTFDKQVAEDKYLAFAADCTNPAKYFYSCECGEAGTETFDFGAALGHTFDKQVTEDKYLASAADCTNPAKYFYSCECGEAGTETFDFGAALGHTFDNQVTTDKYLVSAADCTNAAKYYYSCDCGEAGTETFDFGAALGHDWATEWTTDGDAHWYDCSRCDAKDAYALHTFDQKVTDDKYFVSGTSCTDAAKYYYSCVCGVAGTETFEDGAALGHDWATEWTTDADAHWYACSRCDEKDGYTPHTFDQESTDDKYLVSPADCDNPAKYSKSCVCGVAGTETFDVGAALGHDYATGDEYTADEHGHWHACSGCEDKKDYVDHTSSGPATYENDEVCTVCGYVITPKLTHKIDNEWQIDENGHWKNCSCGQPHDSGEHVAGPWKADGKVIRYRECTSCGYLMDYMELGADDSDDKPEEDDKAGWFDVVVALLNRRYTVVAIAGEGGDITNEGTTVVRYGKTVTYVIEPDDGYEIESVYVDGKNVGAVSEYTFKNVKKDHTIKVNFKEAWFTDVSKNADYYEAVKFVVDKGLFNGVSETKFAPNTTMTRAMFVTVLWRLEGEPVVNYLMNFDDVAGDTWYTEAVRWAASEGIVLGYGDGKFGVDNEITVEQATVILARYAQYVDKYTAATEDLAAYADADSVSDWALEQMKWAVENGVYEGNKFNLHPAAHAPRFLVAEMLYRAYNLLTK